MNPVAHTVGPDGFGAYEVEWSGSQPTLQRTGKTPDQILCPGFVDIHIHGAFGIDFMSATKAELEQLCEKLQTKGYEAFLPTTVTAPPVDVARALANLPDNPMIAGFHLEGPFISREYPGAQPKEFIVDPATTAQDWQPILSDPRLKVITLAPELPGSLDLITHLTAHGVICSMGHTNATYAQAQSGFEAGARHTTHTYNAMRPLHQREAGTVGFALMQQGLSCELIYDRLHVSKESADLLIRNKGMESVIAVSDSSMATGLDVGRLQMWGHECTAGPGWVRLAENSALAGSAITLLEAFQNLAADFGPELAIKTCSLNPRKALCLGEPRVWLEFGLDGELRRIVTA